MLIKIWVSQNYIWMYFAAIEKSYLFATLKKV